MTRNSRGFAFGLALLVVLGTSAMGLMLALKAPADVLFPLDNPNNDDVKDYARPKDDDSLLVDDRIEAKKTRFEP